jgi:hypothetical protein
LFPFFSGCFAKSKPSNKSVFFLNVCLPIAAAPNAFKCFSLKSAISSGISDNSITCAFLPAAAAAFGDFTTIIGAGAAFGDFITTIGAAAGPAAAGPAAFGDSSQSKLSTTTLLIFPRPIFLLHESELSPFGEITGALNTDPFSFAAATLADNFSTNAFTSLKFDLAANASFLFSAADGNLFVLADLAANASLTAIAFLTANICVASSNAFLNAGSDVADAEDGTIVIGADAPFADTAFGDAPFADTAFGDGDGDAAAAFGDAAAAAFGDADAAESAEPTDDQCATHDFGDVPFGAPFEDADDVTESSEPTDGQWSICTVGNVTFGDADAAESAEPTDDQCATHDFGDVTFGDADAAESSEPTDGQWSTHDFGNAAAAAFGDAPFADAFGESKFIIGDDCAGATTATGAAVATAPLDLNPGGPGKNTGSGAGPPFASVDLILTIILGFGFGLLLLLLLDDHELFNDFGDVLFDDDDDDIVLDDVPLLEDFFEPDAVAAFDAVAAVDVFDTVDAVPDDKLLSEDFLELDDADDPFAIKPRFTPL